VDLDRTTAIICRDEMNRYVGTAGWNFVLRLTACFPIAGILWAHAAGSTQNIVECRADDALGNIGEVALVTDVVKSVTISSAHDVVLKLGVAAEVERNLIVIIPAKLAAKVSDPAAYQGRLISVSGKIISHDKRAEIKLVSLQQIVDKRERLEPTERYICPSGSPF
jgi:hypothetical protein